MRVLGVPERVAVGECGLVVAKIGYQDLALQYGHVQALARGGVERKRTGQQREPVGAHQSERGRIQRGRMERGKQLGKVGDWSGVQAASRTLGPLRQHTMGRQHDEPRVLERGEAHHDEVVGVFSQVVGIRRALFGLVGQRGLVAMVAVGDQNPFIGQRLRDAVQGSRVVNPPDAVFDRAVVRGERRIGGTVAEIRARPSGGRRVRVEAENRRDVGAHRSVQTQPILFRAAVGPLVRPDDPGGVRLKLDGRQQRPALHAVAVEYEGLRPGDNARSLWAPKHPSGLPVRDDLRNGFIWRIGQLQAHRVVRATGEQCLAFFGRDHVVWRGDEVTEATGRVAVPKCGKRSDIGHGSRCYQRTGSSAERSSMGCPVLDDLTPEQRAAVTHSGGPLLVLAGAGAGKTRVLCRRLAWLIDQGHEPSRVLGVTFTRQAAEELRGRAEDLLGRSHESLRVSTLHAWAQDVVRRHGVDYGLAPGLNPADQELRKMIVLDRIAELDLRTHRIRGDLARLVDQMITRIDRCRDELVSSVDYVSWAEEAVKSASGRDQEVRARREWEFARVFRAHDAWLADEGLEDFGMSIVRALDLVRTHHDRLEAIRHEVQHLLVDEFQDTNHAQAELIFAVADPAGSVVVVGDDDQGIYRFRGASGKNLADFRRRFPEAAEVCLERNYRSTQAILDAAGAVVEPIPNRTAKRLVALPGVTRPLPRFLEARDPEAQARGIADEVIACARDGIPYHEQAVLMRAVRLESGVIVTAFERAGIPHQVRGGVGLMERHEVRSALAWLRAAVDPTDALAHLRAIGDPAWGVSWTLAANVVASHRGQPVAQALCDAVAEAGGSPAFANVLSDVGRAAADGNACDAIRSVIDRTGLRRGAIAVGGAEGASRLAALGALERLVDDLSTTRPGLDATGVSALLSRLADLGYRGDAGAPLEREGVQVMTVHQAKGLEFDAVYVVGMTHHSWPGRNRPGPDIPDALLPESLPRDPDAHVAESRRLAYVAMTRARTHLTLSWVRSSETGVPQSASNFVVEALERTSGAELEVIDAGPSREQLAAVGAARARFERASMRAAELLAAASAPDAAIDTQLTEAVAALVRARAAALVPEPETGAPPVPGRRPRPGVIASITAIARYRKCPLQYRFAHIDRVPPRPDPSREVGTAAHAALEAFFRPGGERRAPAVLVDHFATELTTARVADSPQGRHALAVARDRFPTLVERTRRSGVVPVAVERPFTLQLGPHRVHGRIDRVDRLPGGGFGLVDYKTGSPPTAAADDDGRMVMRLYLAGARDAWRVEPQVATLEYILEGEDRRENPEGAEIAIAMEQAHATLDEISAGRFEPRPSWSCRTCDYRLLCPALDR